MPPSTANQNILQAIQELRSEMPTRRELDTLMGFVRQHDEWINGNGKEGAKVTLQKLSGEISGLTQHTEDLFKAQDDKIDALGERLEQRITNLKAGTADHEEKGPTWKWMVGIGVTIFVTILGIVGKWLLDFFAKVDAHILMP